MALVPLDSPSIYGTLIAKEIRKSFGNFNTKQEMHNELHRLLTGRRDNLVQQLRAGSLPDLLDDSSELFIGLVNHT